MDTIWVILIALVVGVVCYIVGYTYRKNVTEQKIGRSEEILQNLEE